MDKTVTTKDYVLILLERLKKALAENSSAKKAYVILGEQFTKQKAKGIDYWRFRQALPERDQKIWDRRGILHSKSEITRLRIELNKALIEFTK